MLGPMYRTARPPLDTFFLQPHPATAAWWAQREQCASCTHVMQPRGHFSEATMRCAVVRAENPNRKGAEYKQAYCIDARLYGAACGPEARLFEARGSVPNLCHSARSARCNTMQHSAT